MKYLTLFLKASFVIFLIIFGVGLGMTFYSHMYSQQLMEKSIAAKLHKIKKECRLYGFQPVVDQYYIYTVKPGDTLLSIAEEQLQDSSKIYQIIALNKDQYPMLVYRENRLESGWTLKIPLVDIGIIKNKLKMISGIVGEYDKDKIGINSDKDGIYYHLFNLNESIPALGAPYKVGDCVNILLDFSENDSRRVIQITKQ